MEHWRNAWRNGFAFVLPTDGLQALAAALRDDDPRLVQNSTTTPPPLMCVEDWPVEAADAIAFACWQGTGNEGEQITTVGEVAQAFALACHKADVYLGELSACRWFLNWYDDTPRPDMRAELLAEVERELESRPQAVAVVAEF